MNTVKTFDEKQDEIFNDPSKTNEEKYEKCYDLAIDEMHRLERQNVDLRKSIDEHKKKESELKEKIVQMTIDRVDSRNGDATSPGYKDIIEANDLSFNEVKAKVTAIYIDHYILSMLLNELECRRVSKKTLPLISDKYLDEAINSTNVREQKMLTSWLKELKEFRQKDAEC